MIENLKTFTTTTEIKRFLMVWKTINPSECASPMSTVSKTYQTLRSITDLKEVNKKIVTKFLEHKNGILQNQCQITTSPRQLIFGRDIFMSTILQMKSISKK
jgi:hypothetical protein